MSTVRLSLQSERQGAPLGKLAGGAEADFRTLLARCAGNPSDIARNAAGRRALTAFLSFFATLTASATGDGWQVDPDHPGYVTMIEPCRVAVPYHIAPHFPIGGELALFADLARAVRVGSGAVSSAICLSGSAAMLGMITHYGDIDFCEYLPWAAAEDTAVSIIGHCGSIAENVVCLGARVASYSWHPSDTPPCEPADIISALRAAPAAERRGKMDFVAVLQNSEAAEVTNVQIWLDPKTRDDARASSFSQQEGALDVAGWMPRRLDEPVEVGAYIRFLIGQTDSYLHTSPVKAAKRALSLAFLFHLGPAAQALTDVVNEHRLAADDAARQRRAAAARAVAALGERGRRFADLALAAAARLDPGLTTETRALALDAVRDHVRTIRDTVTAHLAQVSGVPA